MIGVYFFFSMFSPNTTPPTRYWPRFWLQHGGVGDTLATLVHPRSEDLFAKGFSVTRGEKAWFSRFGRPRGAVGHFSRFGAHLPQGHFSQFDPKVPHFSVYFPPVNETYAAFLMLPYKYAVGLMIKGDRAYSLVELFPTPTQGAWGLGLWSADTMLKAHLANIRSTSGLPRLDPLSLCVGGIGKRLESCGCEQSCWAAPRVCTGSAVAT